MQVNLFYGCSFQFHVTSLSYNVNHLYFLLTHLLNFFLLSLHVIERCWVFKYGEVFLKNKKLFSESPTLLLH